MLLFTNLLSGFTNPLTMGSEFLIDSDNEFMSLNIATPLKRIHKRKTSSFLVAVKKRVSDNSDSSSISSNFSMTDAASKFENKNLDKHAIWDSSDLEIVDNSSPCPIDEELISKTNSSLEKTKDERVQDFINKKQKKISTPFPNGYYIGLVDGKPQICAYKSSEVSPLLPKYSYSKNETESRPLISSKPQDSDTVVPTYETPAIEESADYEVEMLLAKRAIQKRIFYFVKWRGYSHEHNTWEPITNLENCKELIKAFNTCLLFFTKSLKDKEKKISISSDPYVKSNIVYLPENIRKFMDVLCKDSGPIITVVNDVDNEGPPENFEYINNNIYGKNVPAPSFKDIKKSCKCKGSCHKLLKSCKCMVLNNGIFPYSESGLVKMPPEIPIYECNLYCGCPSSCLNRVVQNGRRIDLQVFKTINKGWGVRALKSIPKGTFVTEYLGEIITDAEADDRAKSCDGDGLNYLFDLDGKLLESLYTIDGRYKGNVSHFFNHSCDPNLSVYTVFTDNQNDGLHRLAFFATKDIKALEELCINYYGSDDVVNQHSNSDKEDPSHEVNYTTCYCGSSKCRGRFFY